MPHELEHLLERIIHTQEKIMSGVTDLQASVTALQAEVTALQTSMTNSIAAQELILAEIQNLKANGGLSDADAETLSQTVNAGITALQTSGTALDAETTKDGQN